MNNKTLCSQKFFLFVIDFFSTNKCYIIKVIVVMEFILTFVKAAKSLMHKTNKIISHKSMITNKPHRRRHFFAHPLLIHHIHHQSSSNIAATQNRNEWLMPTLHMLQISSHNQMMLLLLLLQAPFKPKKFKHSKEKKKDHTFFRNFPTFCMFFFCGSSLSSSSFSLFDLFCCRCKFSEKPPNVQFAPTKSHTQNRNPKKSSSALITRKNDALSSGKCQRLHISVSKTNNGIGFFFCL